MVMLAGAGETFHRANRLGLTVGAFGLTEPAKHLDISIAGASLLSKVHTMERRSVLSLLGGLFSAAAGNLTSPATAKLSNYPPPIPPDTRATWDKMRTRMLAALPYRRIEVPGERALVEWERLRNEGNGWPVIIGDDEQLDAIAQQFSMDDPTVFPNGLNSENGGAPPAPKPAAILSEAAKLEFPESLKQWSGYDADRPQPPKGEWPTAVGDTGGLTVATEILTGKPFARVHILLIPTANSWEVPAYLRWGDWNDCPPAAQHVAALKHWHNKFGAELVGISRDTLNLRATMKPKDRNAAVALANEQYRYCPDVVDQGVGSLSSLAAILLASDWWFFWWD